MNKRGGMKKAAAGAAALGLALAPLPLAAQSVNDWRLPGATVRPAPPGSQGPVDRDNPVVTTAQPRPTQTATPSPTPSPSASQPDPAANVQPGPAASRPAPQRTSVQTPRQPAPVAAAPNAAPSTQTTLPPLTDPGATAVPTEFTAPPPTTATPPAPVELVAEPGWYWPWIAGAAGLAALLFAGLWWRKRKVPSEVVVEFERPVVPVRTAAPEAPKESLPSPAVEPARPSPLPEPNPSSEPPAGLALALEARRMSASLMATTLSYAVKLTNNSSQPLSALAVEGDMVSAHASLPPEAQIASGDQRLAPRHALVELAPGESAEFTGDFRLPLAEVTPIRAGEAAYFVPLARLRVEASTADGSALVTAQTFVVGELPDDPAAALRPFRLDLGPRTYSKIGQRAVN